MIKRINLLIILVLSTIVCTPEVFAVEYYSGVNVKTAFAEEIDLTNINYVEVFLEDSTEYSKPYLLEKDKNFELSIENVPIGQYNFQYGVVNDDEIGYYKVSADVFINNEANSVDVLVNVSLQNNKQNNQTLTQEDVNRILGTTTSSSNNNNNNSSGIIIDDEDENDDNDDENEETTTVPRDVIEAREKEKVEERKRETRRRNSIIGKILFSIIGIVALILIIYAAIKISRANK